MFRIHWTRMALALVVGLPTTQAQAQLFRKSARTAKPASAQAAAPATTPSTGTGAVGDPRHLMRTGLDYLKVYGDPARAAIYLRQAKQRQTELTQTERNDLDLALREAELASHGNRVAEGPVARRAPAPMVTARAPRRQDSADGVPPTLMADAAAPPATLDSPPPLEAFAKSDTELRTAAAPGDEAAEPEHAAPSASDSAREAVAQPSVVNEPATIEMANRQETPATDGASEGTPEAAQPIGLTIVSEGDAPAIAEPQTQAPAADPVAASDSAVAESESTAELAATATSASAEPAMETPPQVERVQGRGTLLIPPPAPRQAQVLGRRGSSLPALPGAAVEATPAAGIPNEPTPSATPGDVGVQADAAMARTSTNLAQEPIAAEPVAPEPTASPALEPASVDAPASVEDPAPAPLVNVMPPLPVMDAVSEPAAPPLPEPEPASQPETVPQPVPAPPVDEPSQGTLEVDASEPPPAPEALPEPAGAVEGLGATAELPGAAPGQGQDLGERVPEPRAFVRGAGSARSEVSLNPNTVREVEEIARRQMLEENEMKANERVAQETPPRPSAYQNEELTEIPRAPSPTEARPIKPIPVPDDFVPLEKRMFPAYRKYWAAPAVCHMPLYFQDAVLERYGQSAEQALGPHWGRHLSYPLDDPRQSTQRNQILQPAYSTGMFLLQVAMWPVNMLMDPPWEAQYDLGYHRPGDPIPPDSIYWPKLGIGPPLHGMKY